MAASAKHRLGFREKLGLYALALLLIGAALLGYLWFALDRYESNTPESSVRRYLQETAAGQWETILRDAEADLSPLGPPRGLYSLADRGLCRIAGGIHSGAHLGRRRTDLRPDGRQPGGVPAHTHPGSRRERTELAGPHPGRTSAAGGDPGAGGLHGTGERHAAGKRIPHRQSGGCGYESLPRAMRHPGGSLPHRRAADGAGDHRCHSRRLYLYGGCSHRGGSAHRFGDGTGTRSPGRGILGSGRTGLPKPMPPLSARMPGVGN